MSEIEKPSEVERIKGIVAELAVSQAEALNTLAGGLMHMARQTGGEYFRCDPAFYRSDLEDAARSVLRASDELLRAAPQLVGTDLGPMRLTRGRTSVPAVSDAKPQG